jgi:hypothetical protein
MQTQKMSEVEARAASKLKRLRPGRYRATVLEATEGVSPKGNDTLRAVIGIIGPDGGEYRLLSVMSNTPLGALLLRHFCCAVDAEREFEEGHIEPSLFIGREVMATVITEHKRGFTRSVISDYAHVDSAAVVALRSAG